MSMTSITPFLIFSYSSLRNPAYAMYLLKYYQPITYIKREKEKRRIVLLDYDLA